MGSLQAMNRMPNKVLRGSINKSGFSVKGRDVIGEKISHRKPHIELLTVFTRFGLAFCHSAKHAILKNAPLLG